MESDIYGNTALPLAPDLQNSLLNTTLPLRKEKYSVWRENLTEAWSLYTL